MEENGEERTVSVQAIEKKRNGIGLAGFIVSLFGGPFVSMIFNGFTLNLIEMKKEAELYSYVIIWLVGILLSVIGIYKTPRGYATAGLIISFIPVIIGIIIVGMVMFSWGRI